MWKGRKQNVCHRWNSGVRKSDRHQDEWLYYPEAKHDWVADPFITKIDGRIYLTYRKYVYTKRKRVIWYCEIIDEGIKLEWGEEGCLLESSRHLSYPFTFERDGRAYMFPENGENGIWLYTISHKEDRRLKCDLCRLLIAESARDSTLIEGPGRDILLEGGLNCEPTDALRCYLSDDMVDKEIVEMEDSPICIDEVKGRSEGKPIYIEAGLYLRPAQSCRRLCGEELVVHSLRCTHDGLSAAEWECERLEFGKRVKGGSRGHHIDMRQGLTAVDYLARGLRF